MAYLLDASVVIHLLQGHEGVTRAVAKLASRPDISALTRAELENGVAKDPINAAKRRALLDELLKTVAVLPFDDDAAAAYGDIIATLGYSRPKTIDRMLAAQAIVSRSRLITTSGDDFRTIPGLDLEIWTAEGEPQPALLRDQ
jgi:predicted nucleic acid-binding protein